MTSQNLQLVPSPPVLLVCPRSADAVLSLSTFFCLYSCGHLLFKPFLLNSPSFVLCMRISNAALVIFFKVIPKYISNVKWDNQGAFCFSFHLAGQYTSSVLLTGLILTQNS